jgi:oxygen-independent coproporphyrinogen III oxidase
MSASSLDIPLELIERLSQPGPRYTSYPTANEFSDDFRPDDFGAALETQARTSRPLSIYVHLPYCRSLCHYCACNVIVSQRPGVASEYLDLLEREVDLVANRLGKTPLPVTQLHLGGGTPTYLNSEELTRLHTLLSARFDLSAIEEMAVEVDARVTTPEQLETLARLGWNRASFGVQDYDEQVQWAINRHQSAEETAHLIEAARGLGFKGINVDLVYGLPFQTLDTFAATLDEVLRVRPDRVALYSYAHVPWMRPAQQRFDRNNYPRPGPAEKVSLFRLAASALAEAGYAHLGLDHFALPSDELALAQANGEQPDRPTLHRNFQGYTVKRAQDLLGLGLTAISDLAGVYAQNAKNFDDYRAALDGGRLPTERGWALSSEDQARRELITRLMTQGRVSAEDLRAHPAALERMRALETDGVVRIDLDSPGQEGAGLEVTSMGRFFLRNVAMPFDAYLERARARRASAAQEPSPTDDVTDAGPSDPQPRFSQTI